MAARSLGIGTCFTTFPGHAEAQIRALCNIPDDLHLFVYVAVGYPQRAFMPVKRKPIEDLLTWNRFQPRSHNPEPSVAKRPVGGNLGASSTKPQP